MQSTEIVTELLGAKITAKGGNLAGRVVNVYRDAQFGRVAYTLLLEDGSLVDVNQGDVVKAEPIVWTGPETTGYLKVATAETTEGPIDYKPAAAKKKAAPAAAPAAASKDATVAEALNELNASKPAAATAPAGRPAAAG